MEDDTFLYQFAFEAEVMRVLGKFVRWMGDNYLIGKMGDKKM